MPPSCRLTSCNCRYRITLGHEPVSGGRLLEVGQGGTSNRTLRYHAKLVGFVVRGRTRVCGQVRQFWLANRNDCKSLEQLSQMHRNENGTKIMKCLLGNCPSARPTAPPHRGASQGLDGWDQCLSSCTPPRLKHKCVESKRGQTNHAQKHDEKTVTLNALDRPALQCIIQSPRRPKLHST